MFSDGFLLLLQKLYLTLLVLDKMFPWYRNRPVVARTSDSEMKVAFFTLWLKSKNFNVVGISLREVCRWFRSG